MTQGIILFAHGSRDPAWRQPIEAVAERMKALDPAARVLCAYLGFAEPDLPAAAAALIAAGAQAIAIWPMFLGAGLHARADLPRLVGDLRQWHPGIAFTLHPAIAEHPAVLEAMAQTALGGEAEE